MHILVSPSRNPRFWSELNLFEGLENHFSHELAKKYLPRGFGGVLSFGVKGGGEAGSQIVDNFKLISNLAKYVVPYPACLIQGRA